MANPINAASLADLDAMIKRLSELQDRLNELKDSEIQEAKQLEKAIERLTTASVAQRQEIELTAKQAIELKKRYEKYNESLNDGAVKIAALKEAQRQLNNVNKLEAKILASKEGSYNQLSAQYSLNKIRLNQMSAAERNATAEGKKLEKQTAEIYEEMKRLQEATGKHVLSVGDYAKAQKGLMSQLEEMPGALGGAANGVKGLRAQFTKLIKHPIVLVIAAIVAGVTALFSVFKRTESGTRSFDRAMAVSEAIVSKLVAVVDKAAKMLSEDFVGGLRSMAESVGRYLNPVGKMFSSFGGILVGVATLDMEKMKVSIDDLKAGFNELTENLSGTVENVLETADAFDEVRQAKKLLIKTTRDYAAQIENLSTKEAELQVIAGDTTKSLEERNAASLEATKALEKRSELELKLARQNLDIIRQEMALRKGQDLTEYYSQETSAIKEVKAAERELALARLNGIKERNEIAQDQLERELDYLIDGYDNQKTINERRIADDTRAMRERRAILAQTVQLGQDSFDRQIELIQSTTDKQINANELLNESDARVLAEKVKNLELSDIISGRLLEAIRDRRLAVEDLTEAYKDLNGENIVTAQIDTLGVQISEQAKQKVLDQIAELKGTIRATSSNDDQGEFNDIYDLLGIDFGTDARKSIFQKAVDQFKDALSEITQARIEAADRAIEQSEREVNAAENALNREIESRNAGYAANVEQAEKELALAKSNQEKALEEREKAQRAQILLDSSLQTSSLITAAANIWKTFSGTIAGTFLAGGLIAGMFGSFAASKVKALQASKAEFGEGGFEIIGGGSHASGNDTFLGFETKDGRKAYGERGEAHMIIDRAKTAKYKNVLPHLFDSIKQGKLEEFVLGYTRLNSSSTVVDFGETNSTLRNIEKQGSQRTYQDSKGRLVVQKGNIKTVYVQ